MDIDGRVGLPARFWRSGGFGWLSSGWPPTFAKDDCKYGI
jgi:hypothetical protein